MGESAHRLFSPEWFRTEANRYADYEAETKKQLSWFQSQYGPDQLRVLSGKELLTTLFYNDSDKKENLCYAPPEAHWFCVFPVSTSGGAYQCRELPFVWTLEY